MIIKMATDKGLLIIKSYTLKNSVNNFVYFLHIRGNKNTYRCTSTPDFLRIMQNLN